ncbi:MAG: toxin-antitoxin system HicB family antitoxin [Clostridia bacterium]|nr:toxin-antitoxin system HicB family antitoxin [Clostridia bacterium]
MKKDIDYYMNLSYAYSYKRDLVEGGYTVWIPDLKGCITCCDKFEEIPETINDAKRAWIGAMLEDEIQIPEPSDISQYSGQFKLRIPKSLHKSLAEQAKAEGVSLNQFCVYKLSK